MHLLTPTLLTLTTLLTTTTLAQLQPTFTNTTREYNLRTCLKPDQPSYKDRFDNLWLYGYHTGAGLDDATFSDTKTEYAAKGYLSRVMNTTVMENNYQAFNLGSAFPYQMVMAENVNFYAAWQPVRIDAGLGSNQQGYTTGFSINSTGLQWTSTPGTNATNAFGGWLVCDWWHGEPQLFFRISYYDTPAPSSCADVDLIPEYI